MATHAEDHTDYHRGEMDIREQVNTFHLFNGWTKWGSLVLAVSLLTLTLWFATDAGFLGGAAAGFVVLVVGIFALRERKSAH